MEPDSLLVLNPGIEATKAKIRLANRLSSLKGAVIGLLGNRKRNSDALLEDIGKILQRDFGVSSTVSVAKESSSRLAQAELFELLADNCNAAIAGIGDCGSSSSFSVCDALAIEAKGKPSIAIVTDALRSNAVATAEILGAPDHAIATVPHPIASLLMNEVQEIAEEVTPLVARMLLGNACHACE